MEETDIKDIKKEQYELAYVLPQNTGDEGARRVNDEIREHIEKLNGAIHNTKDPEWRKLAYPIKKNRSGYFGFIAFVIYPEKIKDLDTQCKMNEGILRHLVIRVEERKTSKSVTRRVRRVARPATATVSKPQEEKTATTEEKKIELEELEKKLEEILEG